MSELKTSAITEAASMSSNAHEASDWQQTYEQVCDLLTVYLGLPAQALAPEKRLDEDFALDSLDLADLGIAVNERFQIDLQLDVLRLADTVRDLVSLIAAARHDVGVGRAS